MRILVTGLESPVTVEVDAEGSLFEAKEAIAAALGVDVDSLGVSGVFMDSAESVSSSPLIHRSSVDVYVTARGGLPLAININNPQGAPGSGEPPSKLHPPHLPWRWMQPLGSLDYHAVKRGLQVYEEVFAPCHGLSSLTFRQIQDFMTKEDALEFASRFDVVDPVPDHEGKSVVRPAKFSDHVPLPYPNVQAAKFSNNGAAPPNLAVMVFGRHHGHDYIFNLLTGYTKPACYGKPAPEGVWWNPYMNGGFLAMPPPLSDGMLEFWDGTPCTVYQMAKDVVHFLHWTAFIQQDWYKLAFWKYSTVAFLSFNFAIWMNIHWNTRSKLMSRWWQPGLRFLKR